MRENIRHIIIISKALTKKGWKRTKRKNASGRVQTRYTSPTGEVAKSLYHADTLQRKRERIANMDVYP